MKYQFGITKMTAVSLILLVGVIVTIVIAVNKQKAPESSSTNMMMNLPVTVDLAAQNSSTQTGTAVISEQDGKIKISVNLNNAQGTQPAHVHFGTCSDIGMVKYPLTNLVNGKSETLLSISIHDLHIGTYALNVHKSETESNVYVACGDVSGALNRAMISE